MIDNKMMQEWIKELEDLFCKKLPIRDRVRVSEVLESAWYDGQSYGFDDGLRVGFDEGSDFKTGDGE